MSIWAPLGLTTITAGLLVLPVAPALLELYKRRDASPLPTSRHDGRIENFADGFYSRIEELRPQLDLCRMSRSASRVRVGNMEVLLAGIDGFDIQPELVRGVNTVMCAGNSTIPAGAVIDADIFADGALEIGEGAVVRAALCQSNIVLGARSSVLRWLHSRGSIYLSEGSRCYGRLSADQSIRLEPACSFERMKAREIISVSRNGELASKFLCESPPTETTHDCVATARALRIPEPDDVPGSCYPRQRVEGDFTVAAGEVLDSDLIVTGKLRIGSRACLLGSVKSYKELVIEEGACVHGSIVGGTIVRAAPDSCIDGPITAEEFVLLENGCQVGAPDAPTTVSSSHIALKSGCRLHGTVWARTRGEVEA